MYLRGSFGCIQITLLTKASASRPSWPGEGRGPALMAVFTFSCSARFIAMTQASPEVTENNFRSGKKPWARWKCCFWNRLPSSFKKFRTRFKRRGRRGSFNTLSFSVFVFPFSRVRETTLIGQTQSGARCRVHFPYTLSWRLQEPNKSAGGMFPNSL